MQALRISSESGLTFWSERNMWKRKGGINKSNLSLLENGKGNPTLETIRRIAKAIGRKVLITVE